MADAAIVAQDERLVCRSLRQGESSRWECVELVGDDILEIASIGVEIPLGEIDDGVVEAVAVYNRLVVSSDASTASRYRRG